MSEPLIATEGVTKRFGDFTAVKDVTVAFPRDQLTAIIGPNGAGKSTFFNLLTGALPPTSGRIVFDGADITGAPQHAFAHLGIAKSFQITTVFPQLSVFENVRLAAQARVTRFDLFRSRRSYGEVADKAEAMLQGLA